LEYNLKQGEMDRLKILLLVLIVSAPLAARDAYRINPNIDILLYEFSLLVNDTNNIIIGEAVVTISIKGRIESFELDLKKQDEDGSGMKVTIVTVDGSSAK
jgi:hypothetical protein